MDTHCLLIPLISNQKLHALAAHILSKYVWFILLLLRIVQFLLRI